MQLLGDGTATIFCDVCIRTVQVPFIQSDGIFYREIDVFFFCCLFNILKGLLREILTHVLCGLFLLIRAASRSF